MVAAIFASVHLYVLTIQTVLQDSNNLHIWTFLLGCLYVSQMYFVQYAELTRSPLLMTTIIFSILFGLFLNLVIKMGIAEVKHEQEEEYALNMKQRIY
jgi:hypothetical protein